MSELVRPRGWGTQQPPPGTVIDRGHPLALGLVGVWLFNQGAGRTRSLVHREDVAALRTAAHWRVAAEFGVYDEGGATLNSGALVTGPSSQLLPAKDVTIVWRGAFLGAVAAGAQNPRIASMDANATDAAPFVSYGIYRATDDNVTFAWNNGTFRSSGALNRTLSSRYFEPVQLALSHNGDAGTLNGYDGAVRIYTTASLVGTITYAAAAELVIGGSASKAAAVNSVASSVAIWAQPLTADQIAWLAAEPYGYMAPPAPRVLYFALAAAASSDGSLAIAGSGAFAFAGTRVVSGALAVSGSGTLAFAGTRVVSGASAVNGAGAFAFSGTRVVSGSLAVSGSGSYAFSGTRVANGSLAVAGSGVFAFGGVRVVNGTLTISGAGTYAFAGVRVVSGAVTIAGSGMFAFAGVQVVSGTLAISGTGTFAFTGTSTIPLPPRDLSYRAGQPKTKWSGTLTASSLRVRAHELSIGWTSSSPVLVTIWSAGTPHVEWDASGPATNPPHAGEPQTNWNRVLV